MSVATVDYFPTKLAKGQHFYNRDVERAELNRNIDLARHTVLISPRRYGKSSLVHKVVTDTKLPFAAIDLFLAHGDKAVTKRILTGISSAISQIIPKTQKALQMVQSYFTNYKVTLNAKGYGIQFSRQAGDFDAVEQIFDSLQTLACIAEEKGKKVIFFIDEFQDIAIAESAKSIQGAIRHVAQDTSSIMFIFSGSNRHLLLELFDDKSKPLYMLCDKIYLNRMTYQAYMKYIQKVAKEKWGKILDDMVIKRILTLSELHPFYVNLLCNELWKKNKFPMVNDVAQAWSNCYETEKRRVVAELEKLTNNQQDILKAFALNPTDQPTGQEFLAIAGMSMSSVRLGLQTLLQKDMLYQVTQDNSELLFLKKGHYRVLDPLIAYALRLYS